MAGKKKRIVFIGFAGIALIAGVYFFLLRKPAVSSPALFSISPDAMVVLRIPDVNAFAENIEQKDIWNELRNIQVFQSFSEGLNLLRTVAATNADLQKDLLSQPVYAAGFYTRSGQVDFTFILSLKEAKNIAPADLHVEIDSQALSMKQHTYEKEKIYEFSGGKHKMHFSVAKTYGIFMISTSTVLTENAVLQLKGGKAITDNNSFMSVSSALKNDRDPYVIIGMKQFSAYLASFAAAEDDKVIKQLRNFSAYAGFYLQFDGDTSIAINGFVSDDNIAGNFLEIASGKNVSTANDKLVLPDNTMACFQFSSSDLARNLAVNNDSEFKIQQFSKNWQSWMQGNIIYGVTETSDKNLQKKTFIAFGVRDSAEAMQRLKSLSMPDTLHYKSITCYTLKNTDAISFLPDALHASSAVHYAMVNGHLCFCGSQSLLQNIIEDSRRQAVFKGGGTANFSLFFDPASAASLMENFISAKTSSSVRNNLALTDKFSPLELDFIQQDEVFKMSGSLTYNVRTKTKTGLLWQTELQAPPLAAPSIVYDQAAKRNYIFVQDTLLNLYCISAGGDIVWRRQLPAQVHGNVTGVDYYGNKTTQVIFATTKAIQMLDMQGDAVEGFEISFTSPAVNDLAVFKNSNADYIFFIACSNRNIYGFARDGKPLTGWNPLFNAGSVTTPLSLVTTGREDFIFYANTGDNIYMKNGNGDDRRKTVHTVAGIEKAFTADKKLRPELMLNFDADGNSIQIDLRDGSLITLPSGPDFYDGTYGDIDNDSIADMLYISQGKLFVKKLNGDLIYTAETGDASMYKGYYRIITCNLNEKTYAGIYPAIGDQLYLFDEKGKVWDGFPLQGDQAFTVSDIFLSGKPALITAYKNSVLAYRIK